MEHKDLLEDVFLAVLVASTTVLTLLVGWRAGGLARRRGVSPGDATPSRRAGSRPEASAQGEPAETWTGRLVAENARSMRHGGEAAIVALRVGPPRGPLGRRMQPERDRILETARVVTLRSRASDVIRVANDGTIRILLAETTEDGARVYVDRVTPGLAKALAVEDRDVVAAWASMAPSRDLSAADRLAVARLRGATSGWLRSLAVHRTATTEGTSPAAEPGPEVEASPVERSPG